MKRSGQGKPSSSPWEEEGNMACAGLASLGVANEVIPPSGLSSKASLVELKLEKQDVGF